eukprot:750325-Hanusia_phi.AAC.2
MDSRSEHGQEAISWRDEGMRRMGDKARQQKYRYVPVPMSTETLVSYFWKAYSSRAHGLLATARNPHTYEVLMAPS